MRTLNILLVCVAGMTLALAGLPVAGQPVVQEYSVPSGSHPHDVAPAVDGGVWFTAQAAGYLGWLDPSTGDVRQIPLGARPEAQDFNRNSGRTPVQQTGPETRPTQRFEASFDFSAAFLGNNSAPHGVIVGPDGAAWVTDGGQNAIVRVDPQTSEVRVFPLPGRNANLNTATFDRNGVLWFTGQSGVYGRLDPTSGHLQLFDAPRGRGPYGIVATADRSRVFYASLAGNHIAEINLESGQSTPIDPPTAQQGARRVWTDSRGNIWASEWNAGQVGRYDPITGEWREWKLPGTRPQAYAVYVDEQDMVWLSDWGSNALIRFDPTTEGFESFVMPSGGATIRQIHGRPGEVWAAESGLDRLVLIRH